MAKSSPTNRFQPYFLALGLTTVLGLAAMVAFNYWVDPYSIHQWDSALLRRPSTPQQKIVPWAKTYAASRYLPEVVFLGSSRSEIGLPTQTDAFKGKRVLNLAISGASLGDAINMLRHTSAFHRPDMVVWGLDYGWQFREKSGNTDLKPELIAAGPIKRLLLNIKRSLSLAMTTDAVKILVDPAARKCEPILATFGQKPEHCLEYIMADEGGTPTAFDKIINRGDPQGSPADVQAAMQLLERVTREHCSQGTAFRFFFHPVHALAELSYWEANWQDLDRWKEDMTRMVDARRQEGCDIRLMDFSGFNAITTEPVPQVTGKTFMQHYWEHSHYRAAVGQLMLSRLLAPAAQAQPGDFGAELTPSTIGQHLAAFARNRAAYCASHPWETRNKAACATAAARN